MKTPALLVLALLLAACSGSDLPTDKDAVSTGAASEYPAEPAFESKGLGSTYSSEKVRRAG